MRYIDADALLEKLQLDFDKQGRKSDDMDLRGESELSVKYNHGQYCYLNAMEQVKDIPTADVVPKSEVVRMLDEIYKEADQTGTAGDYLYGIRVKVVELKKQINDLKGEPNG